MHEESDQSFVSIDFGDASERVCTVCVCVYPGKRSRIGEMFYRAIAYTIAHARPMKTYNTAACSDGICQI